MELTDGCDSRLAPVHPRTGVTAPGSSETVVGTGRAVVSGAPRASMPPPTTARWRRWRNHGSVRGRWRRTSIPRTTGASIRGAGLGGGRLGVPPGLRCRAFLPAPQPVDRRLLRRHVVVETSQSARVHSTRADRGRSGSLGGGCSPVGIDSPASAGVLRAIADGWAALLLGPDDLASRTADGAVI